MTTILFFALIGGLLIFLSQSSYAYVIASVDYSPIERKVHCLHHAAHAICGMLTMIISLSLMIGGLQTVILITAGLALLLLMTDAISFLIISKRNHFAVRRDALIHKWREEKVFGPEHDGEVSVYRTLKEITSKNLLRDGLHVVFVLILLSISLC